MPVPRRNFMKLLGVSIGSLLLARCQRTGEPESTLVTCYVAEPYTPVRASATPKAASSREQLRLCWLRFGELARKTSEAWSGEGEGGEDNPLGREMLSDHRDALDELTAAGVLTATVADLIQEAYSAAVWHVWRLNVPVTCYDMVMPEYSPASADDLVRQAEILASLAAGTDIPSQAVEKLRKALEHDLAFYALSDADVQALYDRLRAEFGGPGETIPSFEEVELTLTPEVKEAAAFLVDVLSG